MKKKTRKAAKKDPPIPAAYKNGYGVGMTIPGSTTLADLTKMGIKVIMVPKGTKPPKEVFSPVP